MANDLNESPAFEIFTAQKVGLYIRENFTNANFPGIAQSAKLQFIKCGLHNMVAQMTAWLVGGKVPSDPQIKVIRWPDGAWQMFKELHMSEWFKEIFPVRWHTEEFTVQTNHYFVCPHLVTDKQGDHIQFMATGTPLAGKFQHGPY